MGCQLAAARPDIAYHTIALDDMARDEPELIQAMLQELAKEFAAGHLQPLPTTVYPLEEAESAFRLMAQARHMGKVVITVPAVSAGRRFELRRDGTYLVTGGLGGVATGGASGGS
ncbi:MAG: zinc-binding dehydrogenase, partial [Anaerolineae bacterium]